MEMAMRDDAGTDANIAGISILETVEGVVDEEVSNIELTPEQTEAIVQSTIKNNVSARLNERLASMTAEERANARGLLRLKENGKLDEYFSSLFNGETNVEVDAELECDSGYSAYYLINHEGARNFGHAAMIMGSDSEGWYFFSFEDNKLDGHLDTKYYATLAEARSANELKIYDNFAKWDIENVEALRSGFKEASSHLFSNYGLISHNCSNIASQIIMAAGINMTNEIIPNGTYRGLEDDADEVGTWYPNSNDSLYEE